ncbi:TetR/AcrR family transcriptional regulator [Streptomyces iranensis]|uniref:AcrR family transcriptional regulator n=1 Tax=Streptomyces iranensis TaxID=576784 RepID=A0A060ZZF7_9ACTN|nr:TetR/AcrR family transcriptional regulator [Streptomyces iranensis]MBP2066109.1 AcrR family transcriptional regulator [Streptomyces iranensis]CDR13346.1 regulatory protein TetR [Streptomyces iranensis]
MPGPGAAASTGGAGGAAPEQSAPERPAPRLGRKRDHTRDAEILEAALDVLAETGYEAMTIDMVATRAKAGKATIYRRWDTKGHLVLDAVASLKDTALSPGRLPDTGSLRGDMIAMINPRWLGESEQRIKILSGLMSLLYRAPELAAAVDAAIVEPSAAAYRQLMARAVERGEIPASTDIDTLALIIPSMSAYRVMFMRGCADRTFHETLVDEVILPALGIRTSQSVTDRRPAV